MKGSHEQGEINDSVHEAETSGGLPASGGGGDSTAAGAPMPANLPSQIGNYRLKRMIAHGGMGSVYEAVQEHPRRVVALKVMKSGISSRSALRRFEYESQILARLRHPGIAQVYEAGTHDDGSGGVPFFAMEYVPGAKTITEYAHAKGLPTRERLDLFARVCDAVHHGHQKGIIHRDLKPANILVDSTGQPKIIDFGIARATDSDLAVTTLQTQVGELVGTVQYMSPEQCEADPHDLDTRSDVYALGMILYELLCEKLPYDVTRVALFEATRVIREKAPSPLGVTNSELRGDIETITLKALQKDRERRYQSAAELAQDIRRYLSNQSILARPPSLVYQFQTFTRRNKALVASVAAVFIALTIGFAGTTVGLLRARQAEQLAVREALLARESLGVLVESFDALDYRNRADEIAGTDARVVDLLEVTAERLESSPPQAPEVRATLQWAVGKGYRALSAYDQALEQLRGALTLQRQALEAPNEAIAQTLMDLGSTLWHKGRVDENPALFAEAERMFREALAMRLELFGPEHEQVANSMNYLGASLDEQDEHAGAEKQYRAALEMRERLAEAAEPAERDAHRERVARSTNNLAVCLENLKRYDEAEEHYRRAIDIVRSIHGPDHIDVGNGSRNLARCLGQDAAPAKREEALGLYRRAIEIKRRHEGATHASVADTIYHFAELLTENGDWSEAEGQAREALRIWTSRLPDDHWRIAAAKSVLGAALLGLKQPAEAEPLLREGLAGLEAALGKNDPKTEKARERVKRLNGAASLAGDAG